MLDPSQLELARFAFNSLSKAIYEANVKKGWYRDPRTGRTIDRNIPEMLALAHSEISEALEGYRKGLADDHLPEYDMFVVELADTFIRLLDTAGYYLDKKHKSDRKASIGDAFVDKVIYNGIREDHKLENRNKEGGKSI